MTNKNLSEAARALGRRGGLKGGPARAKKLSAERRSEIARKAGLARAKKRDQLARKITGGASLSWGGTDAEYKPRKGK